MNPADRFDRDSWRCVIPQKVKRQNYSKGFGFCDGFGVGSSTSSHKEGPMWWRAGQPQPLTFTDKKELAVRQARGRQIIGFWSAGGGSKIGAVMWRLREDGQLEEIELHPDGFTKTYGMALGGDAQVGFGAPKVKKGERERDHALIWRGSKNVKILKSSGEQDAFAYGTDGTQHVGRIGRQAALWQDDDAEPIILATKAPGSEAQSVRDGQQVGTVWKGFFSRAALWNGKPDAHVDLTPAGFETGWAADCARQFQIGYIKKKDATPNGSSNMESRAVLWHGSSEYLDLHQFVPDGWNVSRANCIEFDGDSVRIVGVAEKVVTSGAGTQSSQALAESTIIIWEGKLRA